jgi:DNA invertase Pin-like site-specific DNA recombinase
MAEQLPERESDIQATIRDWLRWHGWYVVRHHQTLGSHVGLADLQAIKDGQVLMIEVKTRRGRQSQDQLEFEREWTEHGGIYIVARSVEDVQKAIAERAWKTIRGREPHATSDNTS